MIILFDNIIVLDKGEKKWLITNQTFNPFYTMMKELFRRIATNFTLLQDDIRNQVISLQKEMGAW
jgi:hypothetical protein